MWWCWPSGHLDAELDAAGAAHQFASPQRHGLVFVPAGPYRRPRPVGAGAREPTCSCSGFGQAFTDLVAAGHRGAGRAFRPGRSGRRARRGAPLSSPSGNGSRCSTSAPGGGCPTGPSSTTAFRPRWPPCPGFSTRRPSPTLLARPGPSPSTFHTRRVARCCPEGGGLGLVPRAVPRQPRAHHACRGTPSPPATPRSAWGPACRGTGGRGRARPGRPVRDRASIEPSAGRAPVHLPSAAELEAHLRGPRGSDDVARRTDTGPQLRPRPPSWPCS